MVQLAAAAPRARAAARPAPEELSSQLTQAAGPQRAAAGHGPAPDTRPQAGLEQAPAEQGRQGDAPPAPPAGAKVADTIAAAAPSAPATTAPPAPAAGLPAGPAPRPPVPPAPAATVERDTARTAPRAAAPPRAAAAPPAPTSSVRHAGAQPAGEAQSAVAAVAGARAGTGAGQGGAEQQASPGAPVLQTHAAGSSSAVAAAPGVEMHDMIEAIRANIQIASRQGVSQARIQLHPQELGEIRIHLTQSTDGLVARVTADTPAAAQALTQGRGELHQALSSLGLTHLSLDLGSSGQYAAGSGQQSAQNAAAGSRASSSGEDGEDGSGAAVTIEETTRPQGPARGEIVDVLA